MSKNIVAFDVETTGLSFTSDYIIQIAAVKFDTNFNIIDKMKYLVKPVKEFEIAPGALEKHGITKDFILENGEDLKTVAEKFTKFIDGCDMLSYNGKNFDVRMISKDFASVGIKFDIDRVFYDAMLLESILNPRTLEATYKRYTGEVLVDAHDALADVIATVEVFKHQVEIFESNNYTLDDIMQMEESKIFCVDGMIKQDGDKIVFARGKYKDVEFMEVTRKDVQYIKWFMTNPEFDYHTRQTLREYYAKNK